MMKYIGNGVNSFKMGNSTFVLANGKSGKLFYNKLFVFDDDGAGASSISDESISKMINDQRKDH